jgi:predicted DNA-binding WGR domain protein
MERRTRIEMFCVEPVSNKRRRYLVLLRPPATFGDSYEVVSRWGRIGEDLATRVERFADAESALKHAKGIVRLRVKHGYVVVRVEPSHPLQEWMASESFPFEPLPDNQPTLFEDLPPDDGDDDRQMSLF